ncbi:hypothetical protein CZ771_04745 [Actinomycetales bacterium JB111]|nr:hypothetical protein CZ771_04745 [Actinomycetales bacterium JB111]
MDKERNSTKHGGHNTDEPDDDEGAATMKVTNIVSFDVEDGDDDRIRSAFLRSKMNGGPNTLAQFIDKIVMDEVERLEGQYNNGQPFPVASDRELSQDHPAERRLEGSPTDSQPLRGDPEF